MQAPYLFLCSENDDLAPFQVISDFVQQLKDLGGDVKLVKWSASPHVGWYPLLFDLITYMDENFPLGSVFQF